VDTELDHLVVAARTLEEGAAWVEERLGVSMSPGGRHALMGTHNRLLSLGPERFLEVLAIDPEAPAPARPRWFALDSQAMGERLARGPALIHWVERTADIERSLLDYPEEVEVLDLVRGEHRWRIGVPRDGRIPCEGRVPTLIQWTAGPHPCAKLPDAGCTLDAFRAGPDPSATFTTPGGKRTLP
jgi:hypothetical protein